MELFLCILELEQEDCVCEMSRECAVLDAVVWWWVLFLWGFECRGDWLMMTWSEDLECEKMGGELWVWKTD